MRIIMTKFDPKIRQSVGHFHPFRPFINYFYKSMTRMRTSIGHHFTTRIARGVSSVERWNIGKFSIRVLLLMLSATNTPRKWMSAPHCEVERARDEVDDGFLQWIVYRLVAHNKFSRRCGVVWLRVDGSVDGGAARTVEEKYGTQFTTQGG